MHFTKPAFSSPVIRKNNVAPVLHYCKHLILLFMVFLLHFTAPIYATPFLPDTSKPTVKTWLPPLNQVQLPYDRKKVNTVAIAHVALYGGSMLGLYSAWYKDYPQGKFHTFNDWHEWNQVDKVGHVYSAYTMGKFSMELWRYSGIERKKRIWYGGLSGVLFQTVIEVLDGFSTEWGWSWGDMGANILGSAALISQELAWDEQRVQLKTSFHRKRYDDESLNQRSDDLFGNSSIERYLKDYNGQTYWMSTSIKPFFPNSRWPEWLQVSIGYGSEGMFGARDNTDTDETGNVVFNRTDIPRYRQWYLAPDIDLTKIKTRKKGIRFALFVLNSLKFPSPSLELSRGKLSWNWIHF
ncbi:MAG: DUF2279 domain-containing protein [Sphingobacteriales bacterium]|nr:DUF2279 domain-containing protein [Sphingobacteriales bacterium]